MKMRKLFGVLLLVMPLAFFACGDPLPINEIMTARAALDANIEIEADKYFPDEFVEIISDFSSLHQMMMDGAKIDSIRSSANAITKKADELYAKSIPLAAEESIEMAEELMEAAIIANADEFFTDEFNMTVDVFKSAVEEYEKEAYTEAYTKAIEAQDKFEDLRSNSIAQKGVLEDAITEVKNTLAEAEKYNSDKYASEMVDLATENLRTAELYYESLELKRGFAALEAAKLNADAALALSLAGTADEELETARNVIDKAKASPRAGELSDAIDAAEELFEIAESAFEEGNFPESIEFSQEARKIASLVAFGESGDDSILVREQGQDEDGEYTMYRVVRRTPVTDTLWGIAGRFYQNPRLWPKIYNSNKDIIRDPDLIFPGQMLKIPKKK